MSEIVDAACTPLKSTVAKLMVMGRSRSGKTTVANYLSSRYGAAVQSVGQHIKDVSHALAFGEGDVDALLAAVVDGDDVHQRTSEELLRFIATYDPEQGKPRRLYQTVGDIVRGIDPSTKFCWEDYVVRCLSNVEAPMVIVDARLTVSRDYFVQRHSFKTLRLRIPEHVRKEREHAADGYAHSDATVLDHASETDFDKLTFDGTIVNNFPSTHELHNAVDAFLVKQNILPNSVKPDTQ